MKNRKYMDVDVFAVLEEKMKSNTKAYQSDFEIDKKIFQRIAASERKEDKTLVWFSREMGTECAKEHEAFVQNTTEFITCQYWGQQTGSSIVGCIVELTGEKDGVLRGNVYEVDFHKLAAEMAAKAVDPKEVEATFKDGFVVRVPFNNFSRKLYPYLDEHESVRDLHSIPQNERELAYILSAQKQARDQNCVAAEWKPDTQNRTTSLDDKIDAAVSRAASKAQSTDRENVLADTKVR